MDGREAVVDRVGALIGESMIIHGPQASLEQMWAKKRAEILQKIGMGASDAPITSDRNALDVHGACHSGGTLEAHTRKHGRKEEKGREVAVELGRRAEGDVVVVTRQKERVLEPIIVNSMSLILESPVADGASIIGFSRTVKDQRSASPLRFSRVQHAITTQKCSETEGQRETEKLQHDLIVMRAGVEAEDRKRKLNLDAEEGRKRESL